MLYLLAALEALLHESLELAELILVCVALEVSICGLTVETKDGFERLWIPVKDYLVDGFMEGVWVRVSGYQYLFIRCWHWFACR